ncbi:hypothetical protein NEUTE1DRAFT_94144 [Neurospora tetrasperma FGSC 2508]|uniref:Uncharacterized protein n=1 Tax=Neurospora tetrasperma (strain FGSC 2508 / ATCC MYA-4615 / P0657) TaxID=510951 RepID=F8MH81_NEUT8|nr:uncharacterized protein NEUTE1DRAFT_94144 [Neurospora tetrasperma FGSC 2508]EGO58746.1 hypothetical protein NEUTE1DRAFT_94144 [Neurospora tetrasperma FGSC 2508]EGZ72839.1 hypothetical protein NEUTE2DRAFT_120585 [Neurospora tetrasperma FGSC 2509]
MKHEQVSLSQQLSSSKSKASAGLENTAELPSKHAAIRTGFHKVVASGDATEKKIGHLP